ncbi:Uncharacterised protein [Klebsiella pneumoniae]|uniref:Uncharacterized protein n=1 Tax=Klebsiella pneumoniae TaxID=573 RepID=A0A2X3BV32_KLEPN|nr:Uncharacterised protein [Klebsiella pneumoniae]
MKTLKVEKTGCWGMIDGVFQQLPVATNSSRRTFLQLLLVVCRWWAKWKSKRWK